MRMLKAVKLRPMVGLMIVHFSGTPIQILEALVRATLWSVITQRHYSKWKVMGSVPGGFCLLQKFASGAGCHL